MLILCSYPRSGSTWTRYYLEYMTQRPTSGIGDGSVARKHPQLGVDRNAKKYAHKTHQITSEDRKMCSKLILLVRDPVEAITRHGWSEGWKHKSNDDKALAKLEHALGHDTIQRINYMNLIKSYEECKHPKLMVYYEDLCSKPAETLESIREFLELPEDRHNKFMQNYDSHKARSTSKYAAGSITRGEDLNFWAHKLKPRTRVQIYTKLREQQPELYDLYLSRYKPLHEGT